MLTPRARAPLALIALLIVMAVAAPASARITRAQSIIPPGNSGFVSAAGLLTGSGSPHLYDQQALFIAFKRIGDLFNPGGATEAPKAGVTIVRDHYGVPDVTAHTSRQSVVGRGLGNRGGSPRPARARTPRDHRPPGRGSGQELSRLRHRGPARLLHTG